MPYELTFRKVLEVADRDLYLNECCVGGDKVCDALMPALERRYDEPAANQEEWGWGIRMEQMGVDLAVDVFCEDTFVGEFKVLLTSRVVGSKGRGPVVDLPQLEALRTLVIETLKRWVGTRPKVLRLDANFQPVRP